jgi:hypothetical protein
MRNSPPFETTIKSKKGKKGLTRAPPCYRTTKCGNGGEQNFFASLHPQQKKKPKFPCCCTMRSTTMVRNFIFVCCFFWKQPQNKREEKGVRIPPIPTRKLNVMMAQREAPSPTCTHNKKK